MGGMSLGTPIPATSDDKKPNAVLYALARVMGVSDIELADATGLARQVVYNRRMGVSKLKADELGKLADALGVKVDVFFGEPIDAVLWAVESRPELQGASPGPLGASPSNNDSSAPPTHYSAQNRCIAHSHRQVTRFNRRPLTLGNLTRSRRTENSVALNSNQLEVLLLRSGRRGHK